MVGAAKLDKNLLDLLYCTPVFTRLTVYVPMGVCGVNKTFTVCSGRKLLKRSPSLSTAAPMDSPKSSVSWKSTAGSGLECSPSCHVAGNCPPMEDDGKRVG